MIEKVSNNAESYLTAGSSQSNESVNNTMASKNPKRVCLSLSASTDYRFAASVAQKNLDEQYVEEVLNKLGIDAAAFLGEFFSKKKEIAVKRYTRASDPVQKGKRLARARQRNQLKFRNEKLSENIYETSSSFFGNVRPTRCIEELKEFTSCKADHYVIIFYDFETGEFELRDDILQIAMAGENLTFNTYLTPIRSIHDKASSVHKLTKSGKIRKNFLYKNGRQVFTLSKINAFNKMLDYLEKFGKKCLLIAHNDPFDAPRLLNFVDSLGQTDRFKEFIYGFSDTRGIFKKKFPNLPKHKLEILAENLLSVPCEGTAHDASFDVDMLR